MLSLGVLLAVVLLGSIFYLVAPLVIDSRKLRQFPTPSPWAWTPFWLMWHNSRGKRYLAVDEAHRRLGPVIRIASNHVSFSSPPAFKDIYNYGSDLIKDDFYETIADGNPSMAQTADKRLHGVKRRNLAHVFSAQQITAMEPRVVKIVKTLCQRLTLKAKGQNVGPDDMYPADSSGHFDIRPWMNMTSYDVISSIFWSKHYGFLEKGNDICSAELSSGAVVNVHAMDTYHSTVHFNAWLAHFSREWYNIGRKVLKYVHGQQTGDKFSGMARWLVYERLRSPPEEKDLFSSLPLTRTTTKQTPMTFDEVHAESTTMLDAGNDTTQTSLTNCIYQLARHPDKQARLRAALRAALPADATDVDLVPTYTAQLQHVPYLRACLDESFRLRTPLAFGLPRKVVAPGGVTIAGRHILPGTTVSAPLYTLHLNEELFRDARGFVPERWMSNNKTTTATSSCEESTANNTAAVASAAAAADADGDRKKKEEEKKMAGAEETDNGKTFAMTDRERQNLKDYVLPFSLGSRACIGRNLAYMELSIVVAALVLHFEWELAYPDEELVILERFNSNPRELLVKARPLAGGP